MSFSKFYASLIFLSLAVFVIKPMPADYDGPASDTEPSREKKLLSQTENRAKKSQQAARFRSGAIQTFVYPAVPGQPGETAPARSYHIPEAPPVPGTAIGVADSQSQEPSARVDITTTVAAVLTSAPAAVVETIQSAPNRSNPE